MHPIVTTVIPVYNKAKYLNRCLKSIVSQSIREIEIILINDGSTDNSLDICREWAQKDTRIKVFDKKNEGAGAARNMGICESSGKYLSFVDADDYIDGNSYSICVKTLEDTKAEACYFGRNLVNSEGVLLKHSVKTDCMEIYEKDRIRKEFINFFLGNLPENEYERHFVTGSSCCVMFDGDFIRGNHLLFMGKELRYSEDLFFNLEVCRYAQKIAVIPDMLYYNCLYQDSTSRGYAADRFAAYKLLHDKMLLTLPYCEDKEDARMRIDFRFAINLCKCVRDEARYVKQNGLKTAYRNIKDICNDAKTQECVPKLIRKGYASNRNILLRLIVEKKAAIILGYYLLKEKREKGD